MRGFSVKIRPKRCFSRQVTPPGKVKITFSAASDLKISHRVLYRLNRGELISDCAKKEPNGCYGHLTMFTEKLTMS